MSTSPFPISSSPHTFFPKRTKGYCFGFNGKESDNSTSADSYDFGARILDARIGRWLSVDALSKKFPTITPFSFAGNNPIFLIDYDGNVIEPVGDTRGNASASQSAKMLEAYFSTAFGPELANVLMSSAGKNGTLGNFRSSNEREAWKQRFEAAISQITDEHAKSMAIGVFETINSPNKISFIGYAGDAGANGERCRDLNVGKDTGNPDTMENYNPSEPMVNGTPSLCKLKNAVDVLYDVKGPSGRGSEPASALVACSDGQLFNKGSLETPNIAIGINGGNQHQKLAVDVVLSLTNANFKMNQGFSISETSPVKNQDGSFLARFNNATTASAFQNIADVLLRNLKNNSNPQLQNNRMSRQNKDQLEKPYRPDRKKFSEK